MTKDTCISISVLAKKPGSVVLPPLFKKNKKGLFFLLCCLACFPPSTVHSCFSPRQSFAAGGVPSAFDIFRIRKACGNSLFIVPLWLIIQTAALGSERPVICRHCPVRSWTDTLCRIQNLEFIIPMLLYSSLEVTVGAESRIRLPIVGPAISQKCRNKSVNDNNRSSVKITAEHLRGTLPIMGTCYDPAASDLKWVIALFAIFHIKVCLFIIVGQGLLHMQKLWCESLTRLQKELLNWVG